MDYDQIDVPSTPQGRPAVDAPVGVTYRTIWECQKTSRHFLVTSSGRLWDIILPNRQGLHYELRKNSISSKHFDIFLGNRSQRVILNGQYSSLAKYEVGFPQGLLLGPLIFLIYINNLYKIFTSNPKKIAHTTLKILMP